VDNTLAQIITDLVKAHQEIDALRRRLAELEEQPQHLGEPIPKQEMKT